MQLPRGRRVVAVCGAAGFLCAAMGVLPGLPASASCVGPLLAPGPDPSAAAPAAAGTPVPVPVPRSGPVQVSGQWFHDGCDDTSAGAGCSGPLRPDAQTPMRAVALVLEQGGSSWTLGVADARGASEHYSIRWQAPFPDGVTTGPAVLRAAGAELPVEIVG